MFADPVSNLMLIILLFFAGLLVMFVFILRSLELSSQNHEETRRQIAVSLTDLERKVAELAFALQGKGLIELDDLPGGAPEEAGQTLDDLVGFFENSRPADGEERK